MSAWHQFAAAVAKETRLLLRDKEALLILLVMPAVFVLIMSLALRDSFAEKAGVQFDLLIVDRDGDFVGRAVREAFSSGDNFRVTSRAASDADIAADLRARRYHFAIVVPAAASRNARARLERQFGEGQGAEAPRLQLHSDPSLRRDYRHTVAAHLRAVLLQVETRMLWQALGEATDSDMRPLDIFAPVKLSDGNRPTEPIPTSVQQTAPAWTVLAMFFLVVPLSGAFIKERQQGSLVRLQTMPVAPALLLGAKLVPYFVINELQVALVLLEGQFLLPHLGGDRLSLGDAPLALLVVSAATNLAALGYGLVVATVARTPEQATTFGAVSVLILAAIGGIMVPTLVMPPFMQTLSQVSPLAWGLDGFLDVFVRHGDLRAVAGESLSLLGFALACFALASLRLRALLRHN